MCNVKSQINHYIVPLLYKVIRHLLLELCAEYLKYYFCCIDILLSDSQPTPSIDDVWLTVSNEELSVEHQNFQNIKIRICNLNNKKA